VSGHGRPTPLLTRSTVVTIISVLSALLVKTDAGHVSAWLDENSNWIAGAILGLSPAVSGFLVRPHVTPVADPRNNDGERLAPVGAAAATLDAAVVLAHMQALHPSDPKEA